MDMSEELFFNVVKDFEKKFISNEEKGEFVNAFLKEHKMSQRQFAKLIGRSHSTVHDWASNRQMKKYYKGKLNELDSLLDRLLFVLSRKDYKATEKTCRLVGQLKEELERIHLK